MGRLIAYIKARTTYGSLSSIIDEIVADYSNGHLALALSMRTSRANLGGMLFQVTAPIIYNIRHSFVGTTWYLFSFVIVACIAGLIVVLLDSKARSRVILSL